MFYVLWRAYSHYKAYRGATYLEQLLQLGLIVETPSKDLDKVYASVKSGGGSKENHAPDETTSAGVATGASSEGSSSSSAQAKGEAKTAPDGTATPESMVYKAEAPSKAALVSTPPQSTHHTGLLLTLDQVPEIAKLFGLRQTEIMDVNRAVEQASNRIRAAQAAPHSEAE
jgi:hypothetical protein